MISRVGKTELDLDGGLGFLLVLEGEGVVVQE